MTSTRLAVLPNWLGDLVMAEPALRAWGRHHRLVAVAEPALAGLVRDAAIADLVEVYDRRGTDRGLRGLWRRGRALAAHAADEALVLGPSARAAALAWVSGASRRVGMGGEGREFLLTDLHRTGSHVRAEHLSETWRQMATPRAFPEPLTAVPRWKVGPIGSRGYAKLVTDFHPLADGRFAVFAAGATYGPAKQWDAKHFTQLARVLHEARGLHPVFVGSPAAGERALAHRLAEASGGTALAGHTDLPTLAAVLHAAALCVANDSGPMHLAAALGTPTVGIFGSTSPAWTAPRGLAARSVGPAPVPCSPCFLRTCPYARECLTGLHPETVLAVVDALLDAPFTGTQGADRGGGRRG